MAPNDTRKSQKLDNGEHDMRKTQNAPNTSDSACFPFLFFARYPERIALNPQELGWIAESQNHNPYHAHLTFLNRLPSSSYSTCDDAHSDRCARPPPAPAAQRWCRCRTRSGEAQMRCPCAYRDCICLRDCWQWWSYPEHFEPALRQPSHIVQVLLEPRIEQLVQDYHYTS